MAPRVMGLVPWTMMRSATTQLDVINDHVYEGTVPDDSGRGPSAWWPALGSPSVTDCPPVVACSRLR